MTFNFESLATLLLFFLPGFLAAQTFVRNYPYAEPRDLGFVLQIAFWAALVHAIAAPVTIPLVQVLRSDPTVTRVGTDFWIVAAIWFVGFLLLLPLVLGIVAGGITRAREAQKVLSAFGMGLSDQLPTAWDTTFRPGIEGSWMIVRMRGTDRTIAGRYGTGSRAGVSPHPHDLYIEDEWYLTPDVGWVHVPNSKGVWMAADQIDSVEFFEGTGGPEGAPYRKEAK